MQAAPDLGVIANTILDAADVMVVLTDRSGTILYVNRAFTAVTGYEPEEALGGTPRLLRSGLQDDAFYRDLWRTVLAGERWHGELVNRRKDGTLYTDEMTIVPIGDAPPDYFVAVKRDVSTRVQHLTAANPVGVAHVTADGRLLYANHRAELLLGAGFDDLTGERWLDVFDPAGAAALRDEIDVTSSGPRSETDFVTTVRVRSLRDRWIEVHAAPLLADRGAAMGVVLAFEDVTDEVASAADLVERERFARSVLDALRDPTAVVDAAGVITAVNDAWERIADEGGASPEATGVGASYLAVCERAADAGCDDARAVGDALIEVLRDERAFFELEYPCPSPEEDRWYLERITPLAGGQGAVFTHLDITWRRRAEEQTRFLASHDPLTGLLNRNGLLAGADDVEAVLFLDLDGFKLVNDTLGHGVGDEVLVRVADRIRRLVRVGDDVVRLGGDEFAVIIRNPLSSAALQALSARIETSIAAPYRIGGVTATVGVSIGQARVGAAGSLPELLDAADALMYRAKRRKSDRARP